MRTTKISSTETDSENSNINYCCWATLSGGHVISVSHELGREGGELWSKKYGSHNGTLQQVMASLARDWPNFYTIVRKEARLDTLSPLTNVQKWHRDYDVNRAKSEIEDLESQLRDKKDQLRRIKARKP